MLIQLPIGLLQSNCYLVYDAESRAGAVIDPSGDVTPLLDQIREHALDIRYILNTHGHFDHIGANAQLTEMFNAPLGLHPADRALLDLGGGAPWYNLPYIPSPEPALALEDETTLELGALRIQVIHTPGHTPGSVCFYIPAETNLITGDTLFAGSVGRTDLPGGDARTLTRSLRRLLMLPDNTNIYPGHGPASTLAEEKRHNPWVRRL